MLSQASGLLSASELASTALAILRSSDSDDDIQNELFNLLGDTGIDLLMELLQHRKTIVQAHAVVVSKQGGPVMPRPAHPSSNVTVMTADEKLQAKLRRKEEKKQRKTGFSDGMLNSENDLLESLRRDDMSNAPLLSMPSEGTRGLTSTGTTGGKMAFPEGTYCLTSTLILTLTLHQP